MNLVICEDETAFQEKLKHMVERCMEKHGISAEIHCFYTAEEMLKSGREYEIAFLDIELVGIKGIEAAERLHEIDPNCLIIFVTNHPSYLDDAFDAQAFRFLQKPVEPERLERSINSALRRIASRNAMLEVTLHQRKVKVTIREDRIMYIAIQGRRTAVVTTEGEYLADEPYQQIRGSISSNYFCDAHQSYYVNLKYVDNYERDRVILKHHDRIYSIHMSRRKYAAFNQKFFDVAAEKI